MSNPQASPTQPARPQGQAQGEADAATRAIARGQLAPPSPRGGLQVIWRCEECGKPWVMDGPRAILRPGAEELATWAANLHANLDHLPLASCRACDAVRAGVEFMVDEYGAGWGGWGVSIEQLGHAPDHLGGLARAHEKPQPMHLLGSLFSVTWLEGQASDQGIHAGLVTRPAAYREAMRWLAKLLGDMRVGAAPHMVAATWDDEERGGEMAADNPPGFGVVPASEWVWRGALIPSQGAATYCPALASQVMVNLAIALPREEPLHPPSLLRVWENVAARAVDIPLAGAAPEEGQ